MNEDIVYDLAHAVEYVLRENYDFGTGICYFNEVFELHSFWRHMDEECPACLGFCEDECEEYLDRTWLFHHYETGYKFRWYKRIGRSSEDNGVRVKALTKYNLAVEALESIRDDPHPQWRCAFDKTS